MAEADALVTSRVIDAAWRKILETNVPPETHLLQVRTYKRFFYAGAKTLLDTLVYSDVLDESTGDATVQDVKRIDAMMHEINAFFADVIAGRQ